MRTDLTPDPTYQPPAGLLAAIDQQVAAWKETNTTNALGGTTHDHHD